ncbi:MAG: hypothetical protein KDB41_10605, partial [Propionibacteriaceae bacterium]|nr:hypothetical protein [Propionibacteriaceae bacterium]
MSATTKVSTDSASMNVSASASLATPPVDPKAARAPCRGSRPGSALRRGRIRPMANIPRLRIPFAPACSAVLGAWLALTPSLLPRSAIIQGALCAVVAMLAYAVGAL